MAMPLINEEELVQLTQTQGDRRGMIRIIASAMELILRIAAWLINRKDADDKKDKKEPGDK